MFRLTIPQPVENIISRLNSRGYEAYAVGGCVRDALMDREPEDWDITTSASPMEVKELFRRTVDTGIKHGTVTVLIKGRGYEVTTYRIDGAYEDLRHPKEVTFTSDLSEDLKRRDFTINAMAYSPEGGLIDEFGGLDDLEKKVIRCVGEPTERFGEDALRMLRAIRFSAQLGFSIEPATYAAIISLAQNIAGISKERILAELTRILQSDHPEKIREVYETGMGSYISPAFADIPEKYAQTGAVMGDIAYLPAIKYLRLAAFLRPVGPKEAEEVLRDLRSDNETIASVKTLTAWSGEEIGEDEPSVRRAMSRMSPQLWDSLILLNGYSEKIKDLTRLIRERGDCLSLRELAVSGNDLLKAGVKPGKNMGGILDAMLAQVLEDPSRNTKEFLLGTIEKPCAS